MNNMFIACHIVCASSGTYIGRGMSRSPKTATRLAACQAWDNMQAGDKKLGCCSGIGMEWLTLLKGSQVVFHGETY